VNRLTARPSATKRPWILPLAAVFIVLAPAMPARADIVYFLQSVNASAGAFDVLLSNTGASAVKLDGFAFEVTVTTPSGPAVTLTNATTATTASPYIFAGNSLFGPDITLATSNGGKTLDASDAYSVVNTDISLASGATVGLGHVIFSAAGLTSTATVSFTGGFPTNSLGDHLSNNIPITTFKTGTISPTSSSVPEPSAPVLASALLALAGTRWFVVGQSRRKSAAVAA
jgi:hypothetical protein